MFRYVREEDGKKSVPLIWMTAFILTVALAGAASYLYISGSFEKDPAKVQEKINHELRENGLMNVFASVNQEWVLTMNGSVSNQSYKDETLKIIKRYGEIREVVDALRVQTPAYEIEENINHALNSAGIAGIYAQVNKNMTVTLRGSAKSPEEKEQAVQVVGHFNEIKDIRADNIVSAQPEKQESSVQTTIPPPVYVPVPEPSPVKPQRPGNKPAAL